MNGQLEEEQDSRSVVGDNVFKYQLAGAVEKFHGSLIKEDILGRFLILLRDCINCYHNVFLILLILWQTDSKMTRILGYLSDARMSFSTVRGTHEQRSRPSWQTVVSTPPIHIHFDTFGVQQNIC